MGCGSSKGSASAGKKDVLTILLIGLDNSGKTTLTYTLKKGTQCFFQNPQAYSSACACTDFARATVPTVGFNQPTLLKHAGKQLKIYDLGGGARIRGVWKQYLHEVCGRPLVDFAAFTTQQVLAGAWCNFYGRFCGS
jgi:GTPase SAR1 family protein